MARRPSFTGAGVTRPSQAPPAPAPAADWFAKNGMPRLAAEPQKDEAA